MAERKRELVAPNGDKRYVRRDSNGRFTSQQTDVGRSLRRDNDQKAKGANKGGHGDKGDRKPS